MPSDDDVSRALSVPAAGTAVARETIAAIATAAGRGGIGVVRVSGPAVPRIAASVLGALPAPRVATFGAFRDSHGVTVDEGLALYFPAPHSYTGEAVLELHGHGGPVVLHALLGACLDAGARLAQPGEFTQRAFLEGKLDLAQAEATADLIDAASQQAARSAVRSLQGEFSGAVETLRLGLVELRALTEAGLDFPEEEIDAGHAAELGARLSKLRAALEGLRSRSRQGALLREGLHVVLAGLPNVGKSSLLNRLLGEERAIVTPVPGTTRDTLREIIHIDGVPLVMVDTAGLRESNDAVERIGVERTRRALEEADIVLAVLDASAAEHPAGLPANALPVYNKVDLVPGFRAPPGAVAVSARTGEGLDALRASILRAAGWNGTGETAFLARERHLRALEETALRLEAAAALAARPEVFAEELRLAQLALGSVTGREFSADDLLGEIFSRFCIGK